MRLCGGGIRSCLHVSQIVPGRRPAAHGSKPRTNHAPTAARGSRCAPWLSHFTCIGVYRVLSELRSPPPPPPPPRLRQPSAGPRFVHMQTEESLGENSSERSVTLCPSKPPHPCSATEEGGIEVSKLFGPLSGLWAGLRRRCVAPRRKDVPVVVQAVGPARVLLACSRCGRRGLQLLDSRM